MAGTSTMVKYVRGGSIPGASTLESGGSDGIPRTLRSRMVFNNFGFMGSESLPKEMHYSQKFPRNVRDFTET